jgi:hypothetical protein
MRKSTNSNALESATGAGESPVEAPVPLPQAMILSTTRHVQSCGKQGRPLSKAKDFKRPIVN